MRWRHRRAPWDDRNREQCEPHRNDEAEALIVIVLPYTKVLTCVKTNVG
jgi:hypothetical protein